MVVGPAIRKTAKRFVLAAVLALLLPGVAGAAGFDPAELSSAEPSFWEDWAAKPAAFFARVWEGLTGVWTAGVPAGPGDEGADRPDTCVGTDCGPSIDPNG
jgi:hypothetical protein